MADNLPFRYVDPSMSAAGSVGITARPTRPSVGLDWGMCIICQSEQKSEKVRCPANNNNKLEAFRAYETFSETLVQFQGLDSLPSGSVLGQFIASGVDAKTAFQQNAAKWHRSCYIKYNANELSRAQKRKRVIETETDMSLAGDDTLCLENKLTRSQANTFDPKSYSCFFFEQPAPLGTLSSVSTFELDQKIRICVHGVKDTRLLAKLSGAENDLIASEAKYHLKCLVSLYNRQRAMKNEQNGRFKNTVCEGIALAHVVRFIVDTMANTLDSHPVLKMPDLKKMYMSKLHELLCSDDTCKCTYVHDTRLRERILCHIPDLYAQKVGKSYVLLSNSEVGNAVRRICESDCDDDALVLSKAAAIVRKEMLSHTHYFQGSFHKRCQEESIPPSLLALVEMILNPIGLETVETHAQPALTIAQLLQFNVAVKAKHSTVVRHTKSREPPLPVNIGLSIHARTRQKDLVENMHALGLSVSYARVLEISTEICNKCIDLFTQEHAVCPPNLKYGLFTTAAIDNLDHNPSSTTSTDSFHGTGLSLFQHPSIVCLGTSRQMPQVNNEHGTNTNTSRSLKVPALPASYSVVLPAALHTQQPDISDCPASLAEKMVVVKSTFSTAHTEENKWLQHITHIIADTPDPASCVELNISWSAYHASLCKDVDEHDVCISSLLPLFTEDSKSIAMLRHSLDIILSSVRALNGTQIPVVAVDQPLFALCKLIQWNWPDRYGEDHFVIMFGAFHIEQAWLRLIGKWMDGCGWTDVISECNIASAGVAESLISVSHVTRSRHAHEVTAAALHMLLNDAYTDQAKAKTLSDFHAWCSQQCSSSVQFHYWLICFRLEMILLVFVRSIREGDFDLFVETLKEMIPWFFALDHVNYARWLPIHLKDMISLETRHPTVHEQFKEGHFVVRKTIHKYSAISLDQAHEQNNASVKGMGGAIGLLTDAAALRRWMISGPEIGRMVDDFEQMVSNKSSGNDKHHEQYTSFQQRELAEVQALKQKFEVHGNPFLDDGPELFHLTRRTVAADAVCTTVHEIEELGKKQFAEYVDVRVRHKEATIFQPLKKNSLPLFKTHARKLTKCEQTVKSLKADCNLFSRLYVACQIREGNLDEFFSHENQSVPPSLSRDGHLRLGTKSDIVGILEAQVNAFEFNSECDAVVYDGAALVNILVPRINGTFGQYAEETFCPYLLKHARDLHATRIDIVWDTYQAHSLKAFTRTQRGVGSRRQVKSHYSLPTNWQDFLRNSTNKEELFHLLADACVSYMGKDAHVVSTIGPAVVSSTGVETQLKDCSHEEADSRMILHIADIVSNGRTRIVVRTVDSDVLVLCIAYFFQIPNISELWVAFGAGKNYRFVPAHEIAKTMGRGRSLALPGFHAFTGCDTVSAFNGCGKKTAWECWSTFTEATRAFEHISLPVALIPDDVAQTFERFVVLMYRKTSVNFTVNQERLELFTTQNRSIENIPPTSAALTQHILRATYQAGHCWGQALLANMNMPNPGEWGWKLVNNEWSPLWTLLPEASMVCRELLTCGCKKQCGGACKCIKANLPCTSLCQCMGECRDS